ncbi:MAG: FKBP-type peptidyl-prolyl cis-trans isomerase [Bacteroidales bacterium]|nr:FKBP-type peptidyl-prolyl cis-trans isomerase [Bacteroidales bacterium]MBQ5943786.1 FKBP-type peptidyl-prolyl cis-trans isomerase [Bacteroidales bacterium]
MKTIRFIALALAAAAAVACNSPKVNVPEGEVNPETLKPAKSLVDSASYLLGINFGSMVKGYNMGDINYSEVRKGVQDFLNAKGLQTDPDFTKQFKINPEEMGQIMNSFIQKRSEYTAALNKIEGLNFLNENKNKEGVQVTESGLQYTIVEPGNDVHPAGQDTVFVHYKGTTLDGTIFDETKDDAPSVHFALSQVIKGWSEGISLIGEGGKIKLFIPADLAYGDKGAGEIIKPGSALQFDVTLDSVKRYVAPVEPKKK